MKSVPLNSFPTIVHWDSTITFFTRYVFEIFFKFEFLFFIILQEGIFECKEEGCLATASNRGGIIAHCKTKHGQGSTDPQSYFHLLNFNGQNGNKINNGTQSYQLNSLAANLPTGTASSRLVRREQQFETVYVNCVIQHCGVKMPSMDELNDHLLKVHGKSPVFCPIYRCTETFDQM